MAQRYTYKMLTFARRIVAGRGPSAALVESDYETDNLTPQQIAVEAQRVLNHPLVAAHIAKAISQVDQTLVMTRQECVERHTAVGRGSMSDLVEFRTIEVVDRHGKMHNQAIWAFKDSDEMTSEQLACISEIGTTASGQFKFKLHDPIKARQELARLEGWHSPPKVPVNQDGKDQPAVTVLEIVHTIVDPAAGE